MGMWRFGRSIPSAELLDAYRPDHYFHRRSWLPYLHGYGQLLLVNSLVMTLVAALIAIQYTFPLFGLGIYHCTPWDTFVLIGLWLWCAFRGFADKEEAPAAQEDQGQSAEGDRLTLPEPMGAAIVDGPGSGQPELRTAPS